MHLWKDMKMSTFWILVLNFSMQLFALYSVWYIQCAANVQVKAHLQESVGNACPLTIKNSTDTDDLESTHIRLLWQLHDNSKMVLSSIQVQMSCFPIWVYFKYLFQMHTLLRAFFILTIILLKLGTSFS